VYNYENLRHIELSPKYF